MKGYIFILSILSLIDLSKSDDYSLIDLGDILNADYMPGSLLVLENPEEINLQNNTKMGPVLIHQGSIKDALTTMNFHRRMMNEYLCRSYISEQIISEMRSSRIRRRLGNPMEYKGRPNVSIPPSNVSIKNNLLEDEGSTSYQDWLKKSATLEDIYRHYDSQTSESNRDDAEDHEEFDGHITGYAFQHPHQVGSPSKFGHSGTGAGYPSYHGYGGGGGNLHSSGVGTGGGGLYGYHSGGHSGYGGGTFSGHNDHGFGEGLSGHGGHHEYTAIHEYPKHHGGHGKDKLADLFDVALTALAYLSFGMFIVQVIMCISMGTTTTAAMTVMPMSMAADTGGGMNRGDVIGGGHINGGGIGSSDKHDEQSSNDDTPYNQESDEGNDEEDFGEGYVRIGKGVGTGTVNNVKIVWNGWGTGETGDGEADESASADADIRDGSKIRGKREIPIITQPNNELLNDLSRRVLISIEAALVAHQDDGDCLRRTLCDNNLYSRNLEDNQKYWMPVWSLGMSWLSGKLIKGIPSTTSMLESLKASILGLGKADCEFIYSQCDLSNQREIRRRRRKRSA